MNEEKGKAYSSQIGDEERENGEFVEVVKSSRITSLTIGDKLQHFYLVLANEQLLDTEDSTLLINIKDLNLDVAEVLDRAYSDLIICLQRIESHSSIDEQLEPQDVIREIIKDCGKKSLARLRFPHAELLRTIITKCRRKITANAVQASKNSVNSQFSQKEYSDRHVNAMIELLGSWSNVVYQVLTYDLSPTLTHQILQPLYSRVLETSFDIFTSFQTDKNINDIGVKLLNSRIASSSTSLSKDDTTATISFNVLDQLISQILSIREVIIRHYDFHENLFSSCGSNKEEEIGNNGVSAVEVLFLHEKDEYSKWRELEAIYLMLEYGYLYQAIEEALKEINLIEIEPLVYVPQAFEDLYFLLVRTTDRAISFGSESCLFAVGSKIFEILTYENLNTDLYSPDIDDVMPRVLETVKSKASYRNCVQQKKLYSRYNQSDEVCNFEQSNSSFDNLESANENFEVINSILSPNQKELELELKKELNAAVEIATSVGSVASEKLATVNQWFQGTDVLDSLIGSFVKDDDVDDNEGNGNAISKSKILDKSGKIEGKDESIVNQKNKLQVKNESQQHNQLLDPKNITPNSSINDILNVALELDTVDHNSFENNHATVPLKDADWRVQLNALSMIVMMMKQLIMMLQANESFKNGTSSKILLQEAHSCMEKYEIPLRAEIIAFSSVIYERKLKDPLLKFMSRSFEISGGDMEERMNDNKLSVILCDTIEMEILGTKSTIDHDVDSSNGASKLSDDTCNRCIVEITKLTGDYLLNDLIKKTNFNEWGALLIYEEISHMIMSISSMVENEEYNSKLRGSLVTLTTTIKVLTVDAPGDVSRYKIPSDVLESAAVREILSKRVDFSREAISNIK